MQIVNRKITDLRPAEYNPRQLSKKQFEDLKASLDNLGTLEPAVINRYPGREDIIISGHQRLKVAEALGMVEYPCFEVSFPEAKEREANIRMNRNTGDWDWDLLANNFDVEELKDWGFDDKFLLNMSSEIKLDSNSTLADETNTQCPKCGYKFNSK